MKSMWALAVSLSLIVGVLAWLPGASEPAYALVRTQVLPEPNGLNRDWSFKAVVRVEGVPGSNTACDYELTVSWSNSGDRLTVTTERARSAIIAYGDDHVSSINDWRRDDTGTPSVTSASVGSWGSPSSCIYTLGARSGGDEYLWGMGLRVWDYNQSSTRRTGAGRNTGFDGTCHVAYTSTSLDYAWVQPYTLSSSNTISPVAPDCDVRQRQWNLQSTSLPIENTFFYVANHLSKHPACDAHWNGIGAGRVCSVVTAGGVQVSVGRTVRIGYRPSGGGLFAQNYSYGGVISVDGQGGGRDLEGEILERDDMIGDDLVSILDNAPEAESYTFGEAVSRLGECWTDGSTFTQEAPTGEGDNTASWFSTVPVVGWVVGGATAVLGAVQNLGATVGRAAWWVVSRLGCIGFRLAVPDGDNVRIILLTTITDCDDVPAGAQRSCDEVGLFTWWLVPVIAYGDGEVLPCEGPDVSGIDDALERAFQLEAGDGTTVGAMADLNAGDVSVDGEWYSACTGTHLGSLAGAVRSWLSLLLFIASAWMGWNLSRRMVKELRAT